MSGGFCHVHEVGVELCPLTILALYSGLSAKMNRVRPQQRYVFRPPRYSPALAAFLQWVSRKLILRRQFRVERVSIGGAEALQRLVREGTSLLIAPNHADHADPHVLMAGARAARTHFHFMAAREGFERGAMTSFFLQRAGAFSVDREGADVTAIKTAMQILKEGRFPLVIFPEGEIYHHQEKLDALNEGVATILLRATDRLGGQRRSMLVPTAIRYHHKPEVAETFAARLALLEERVTWKPRPRMDPVERIYRLGSGLVALKEEEFLGGSQHAALNARIRNLQERLVEQVEERHGRVAEEAPIPQRVKWLRNKIRKLLADSPDTEDEPETWERYDDLDRLFTAVQLYSYSGQYLLENPSTDRIAETLLKLEEDVLGAGTYPAARSAHVQFGEPIDVAAFLEQRGLDSKSGVTPLTICIADCIQAMLEERQNGKAEPSAQ